MGSHDIQEFVKKDDRTFNAATAFQRLRDRDLREYGADAYSGSWGTVSGTYPAPVGPKTMSEAEKYAEAALDHLSKWEDCEYLEILSDDESKTRTDTISVDEPTWRKFIDIDERPHRLTVIEPLVKLNAGEYIAQANGPSLGQNFRTEKRRVQIWTPVGEGVTRYFLVTDHHDYIPKWENGFATQAEARKALERLLRDFNPGPSVHFPRGGEMEIIGIRRRVGGEGLVRGVSEVISSSTPITVTIKTKGSALIGWYFYGWAAS